MTKKNWGGGGCSKKAGGESGLEAKGIETHFLVLFKPVPIDSVTDLGS